MSGVEYWGENGCLLLRVCPLLQLGHVQLAGAQQLVYNEPGELTGQPVWTGSALRDLNRFHRPEDSTTGCSDYHESRRLPSCQQLQSRQLEAEPEGYLSVFRVEWFSRDQKTQGKIKWQEGNGCFEGTLMYDWPCVFVRVCVWAVVACVDTSPPFWSNTNIRLSECQTTVCAQCNATHAQSSFSFGVELASMTTWRPDRLTTSAKQSKRKRTTCASPAHRTLAEARARIMDYKAQCASVCIGNTPAVASLPFTSRPQASTKRR